jgi:hypothetical protein
VLVDEDGHVMIIDFGDVDRCPLGIDPLVLEMSILFHPDRPNGTLPTPEDGARWPDAEYFCSVSPCPLFATACREWLMNTVDGAGAYVLAYLHALRQLKYPDSDKGLALAIAQSCALRVIELT